MGEASRHPDWLTEDKMCLTRRFAAVLDGVTSLRPSIAGTLLSPGLSAVNAVAAALEGWDPPDIYPPSDIVSLMHAAVRAAGSYAAQAGDRTPPACAAAVLDAVAGHIVRVGDIHVVVDGRHYPPVRTLDELLGAQRARFLQQYLALGCPVEAMRALDPGRVSIQPAIETGRKMWNRSAGQFGTGRIDGTSTPDELVDVIDVTAASEVVMATDGYIEPHGTLDESEQLLAERIGRDPLMIEAPPQTKGVAPGANSFDDRLYLRVALTTDA